MEMTQTTDNQTAATVKVSFTLTHNISHSKGWGRYAASTARGNLVQSSTGNEWVSASHVGEATEGTEITAKIQYMLRTKKGREEIYNDAPYKLIAKQGATAKIGAFNGVEIMIEGAEKVA
jgi:hypothetical protein